MTRPTIRIGGEVQGCGGDGGGGGGGGTAPNLDWTEAYHQDFAGLADTDLTPGSGDGSRVIDGKTWRMFNAAKLPAAAVGATHGGIKLSYTAAQQNRSEGNRDTGGMGIDVAHLLEGTDDFNLRTDSEFRISWRWAFHGAAISTTYDGRAGGIATPAWNAAGNLTANKNVGVRQGSYGSYPATLDRFTTRASMLPSGSLLTGKAAYTEADIVADYPNCCRLTVKAGRLVTLEYALAAADLDSASWVRAAYYLDATIANTLIFDPALTSRAEFWFGLDRYYGAGTLGGVTLQELRAEGRASYRSDLVVAV